MRVNGSRTFAVTLTEGNMWFTIRVMKVTYVGFWRYFYRQFGIGRYNDLHDPNVVNVWMTLPMIDLRVSWLKKRGNNET